LFSNIAVKNMALIAGRIPSSEEIAAYQAWKSAVASLARIVVLDTYSGKAGDAPVRGAMPYVGSTNKLSNDPKKNIG